ncbi:MAG: class I SAM-dependent methyltransferase [Bacteroidetes bacterium]|nr:class I SAM-dependent methyltransferase [Bacteroidota bacterium]
MENFDKQLHWENIYKSKQLTEVSWYQPIPHTSLNLIKDCMLPFTAKVIDIGGGDSFLADYLLELGYQDITVLDISETAIERAKKRLGDNAAKVKWIVSDITAFKPTEKYDCWHDRAAFHFLTNENEIGNYLQCVQHAINTDGILIIGCFSENGPRKCSGITIQQYSETSLSACFAPSFEKIDCFTIDHKTPFDTLQNFIFGRFRKK